MNIPTDYILFGAIFLFVVLAVEALYLITAATQSSRQNANRRMAMIASGASRDAVVSGLRLTRRDGFSLLQPVERLLVQSGARISLTRLLLLMLGLSALIAVLLLYVTLGALGVSYQLTTALPHAMVGLVLGTSIPLLVLSIMRGRRIKKFQEQLPDALDAIVRGLKAGHPISAALQLVTEEMADPIGTEFGLVVDEMTYGLDLQQSLEKMAERMNIPDLQYFVVAVNIQHDSGGNLAEILTGLSRVIRERFRLFKKVRALSAEGRLSAMLLSVLPFATAAIIFLVNPRYYLDVLGDALFLPGIGLVFVMMLFGIVVMYRMVNFRV